MRHCNDSERRDAKAGRVWRHLPAACLRALGILCALLLLTTGSLAQAQDASAAARAREAAESARKAANEAQRELDQAQRSLEEAQTRADETLEQVEAVAETAAEPTVADALEEARQARRRAVRAERRAAEAERLAREALARVEELEEQFAYDRLGVYVGGAAFYAPEVFDEASSVTVKSSAGASARLGYRVHPNIAVDARFDWLDGFKVRRGGSEGEIDGWALTGNVRAILLPWRWQPWMGVGVGAIVTDFDGKQADGRKLDTDGTETDPIFRFAAGFDTYLTPSFVLTVEAAMNAVTDDRDYINYGQLSVGLDYRF